MNSSDDTSTPLHLAQGQQRRHRRRKPRARHLFDYLRVVRSHAPWVLVAFAVVVVVRTYDALTATPVYRAHTVVQIEQKEKVRSQGSVGPYWAAWDRSIIAAEEILVIQSWPVARKAALVPGSHATAHVVQRNAYRPLEAALRKFGYLGDVADLAAYTPPLEEGKGTWLLRFDRKARTLTIHGGTEAKGQGRLVPDFTFAEPFVDLDLDGRRTPAEPFVDADGDGTYDPPERFRDLNRDGRWNPAEAFVDTDGNGRWDIAETFSDLDGDGIRDDDEPFVDRNGNGRWDDSEPLQDENANGWWDDAEPLEDADGDGIWDPGEVFEDLDGDGMWDPAEPFEDQDGDGTYDDGTVFELRGQPVRLALEQGDPEGRDFLLTLRSPDEAARWIKDGVIAYEQSEYTTVLAIGYRAQTPHLASAVANAVGEAYAEHRYQQRTREVVQRLEFLGGEIERLDAELARLERQRDDYVSRTGTVMLSERARSLMDEQGELVRERARLESERRALVWRLGELDRDLPADRMLLLLGGEAADAKTAALAARLSEHETELQVMRSQGLRSELPEVQRVQTQIDVTRTELAGRVEALVAQLRRRLETQRDEIDRRMASIKQELVRQDELLRELPDRERDLVRRNRPIEVQAELYAYLVRTKKEAEVARESVAPDVTTLSPARAPSVRESPNLTRHAVMTLVLALLAALGAAFVAEYLVRSVQSPQELEEGLGLPVYGSIPDQRTVRRKERRGLKRGQVLPAMQAPNSVMAEGYRMLRANVRFANPQEPIQALAITSAMEKEGKTTTTLNLAIVAAQAGTKTIVVDADLRRPTTHTLMEIEREPGLVEVLRGEAEADEAIVATKVENLSLLPAGRSISDPSALLDSERFRDLLQKLRDEYAFVLFDLPPVLAVADAAAFFRQLDAVLLLTRYRRCEIDVVDGAREQIERVGGNVIGCVFNGFDARSSARRGYGYYGYYGYYTRHGGAYGER